MSSELRHVERDENQLRAKERDLEKKTKIIEEGQKKNDHLESWGEDMPGEIQEIHMIPLMPHIPPPPPAIGNMFRGIGDMIRRQIDQMKHTGPVHHHTIFSSGNLLRPGSHPSWKENGEEKHEEKHAEKAEGKSDKGDKGEKGKDHSGDHKKDEHPSDKAGDHKASEQKHSEPKPTEQKTPEHKAESHPAEASKPAPASGKK
uniref:Uncharacterized protein n=1 Tax=Strombidium inclinatum TaxID=197538 RepID=A0A7S3IGE8_9SPIT|mmetsp:Transcript_14113/g.21988  ORF Transcript_14113/g.21988 Transcript_14113/m.21988 type:complete len:202 (+) Transcript_14113:250-855(+)